jgi:hypothetical protein
MIPARVRRAAYWLLILILLGIIGQQCRHEREEEARHRQNAGKIQQDYETKIARAGQVIARQRTLILDKEAARQQGLREIEGLKSTISQIQVEARATIRDVQAAYTDGSSRSIRPQIIRLPAAPADTLQPAAMPADSATYIRLPQPFRLDDPWYHLSGSVQPDHLHIDSLQFISQPTITIGYGRGLLRPGPLLTDYRDANPAVRVVAMSSIRVQEQRRFYQRGSFWFGFGNAVGFALGAFVLAR